MSAAYAYVSYYTAYLKTYYPVEFMAALLSSQMGNSDKVADYINEARRMGIEVLGPDVNYSRVQFTVEDGKIRFGLEAVKNVGAKAIEEIINARAREPFADLRDFCDRVDVGKVNQRVVESLIKAGAFSSFSAYRSQLLEVLPQVFSQAQSSQRKRGKGQISFADLVDNDEQFQSQKISLPNIAEFSQQKLLSLEKEMLGLYFSGHPLENGLEQIKEKRSKAISKLTFDDKNIVIAGIITVCREIVTKNQREMAFLTLEDETEEIEVIVFPDTYENSKDLIEEENIVVIKGRSNEEKKVIANKVRNLEQNFSKAKKSLSSTSTAKSTKRAIHLQLEEVNQQKLSNLKNLLVNYQGPNKVYLHLIINKQRISIKLDERYNLTKKKALKEELDQLNIKHSF